jgi:hypothetical protein
MTLGIADDTGKWQMTLGSIRGHWEVADDTGK